jgi:DNA-binding protein HU-beta
MGKFEIIDAMALATGLTKKDSGLALAAFVETVETALTNGEKVSLSGFGTWEVKQRAARNGVNPQTQEKIVISARKAPVFKASAKLKDLVAAE